MFDDAIAHEVVASIDAPSERRFRAEGDIGAARLAIGEVIDVWPEGLPTQREDASPFSA